MRTFYLPFTIFNGKVATTSDIDQIVKQKIIDVLTTDTFERVMRHTYGCGVYSMLYEPINPLIFADFKIEALQELNKNITGAKIMDISVVADNSLSGSEYNTTIKLSVRYRIPPLQATTMTFAISEFLTEESFV